MNAYFSFRKPSIAFFYVGLIVLAGLFNCVNSFTQFLQIPAANAQFYVPEGSQRTLGQVNTRDGTLYNNFLDTPYFEIEIADKYLNGFTYVDEDNNNAPDEIDELGRVMDQAFEFFMEAGYTSPRNVFNVTELYVLLDDEEEFLRSNTLGIAVVSQDGDNFVFPFIILNPNYLYPPSGEHWDEKTQKRNREEFYSAAVHELYHLIQFTYAPEFSLTYREINFAEGAADWVTDEILPDYEVYQDNIADYLNFPDYSIFGTDQPNNTLFKYGTALWPKFLSEKYGSRVIRFIFEKYFSLGVEAKEWHNTLIDATENALNRHQKTDLGRAYQEFAIWNYDMARYEEGGDYPKVKIQETVSEFPYDRETSTVNEYYARPRLFGSNYIEFETAGKGADLSVMFDGHEDAKWSVVFLANNNGVVTELARNTIFPGEGSKTFTVPNAGSMEKVAMIASVVGSNDAYDFAVDNGYSYNYYASFTGEAPAASSEVSFATSYGEWSNLSGKTGFADLSKSHKNYRAILYLKENGVISGYPDGTFQPAKTINRAELMKILVTNQNLVPDPAVYKNCFPDVKEEWFAPYVCYSKERGWVAGYPDGTFKPANTVNKVEALKMLIGSREMPLPQRVESLPFSDTNPTDWYAGYVDVADRFGLLEEVGGMLNPGVGMDRGAVSENIYRLLQLFKLDSMEFDESPAFENINDYLMMEEGRSWLYRVENDGSTEQVTISKECQEFPTCFVRETSDSKQYYTLSDEQMAAYKYISEEGSITYGRPEIAFSNREFVQYLTLKGTVIMNAIGLRYDLLDEVVKFDILGEEEVTTPAGTFTALKVRTTYLINAEASLIANQQSSSTPINVFVAVEEVSYYAKGIGRVKSEYIVHYDFSQNSGTENLQNFEVEMVETLLEYQPPLP